MQLEFTKLVICPTAVYFIVLIRYSVILKLVVAEGTMTCIDHAIAKSINEVVINN